MFQLLETSLWLELDLNRGYVYLDNIFFNAEDYLQVHLELFPSTTESFNKSEIQTIAFAFGNHTYKPPSAFGPYAFVASPYIHS